MRTRTYEPTRGGEEEEDDSGAHASGMWEKERDRGNLDNMKMGWSTHGSNGIKSVQVDIFKTMEEL